MTSNSVNLTVFRYNPHANLIIIIYAACFFGYFYLLLTMGTGVAWLGLPLVIAPLVARFSKNPEYKLRVPDVDPLILSTDGIFHGEETYPASDIEAVGVYLYAFDNFEYRDGAIMPSGSGAGSVPQMTATYVKARGDKNTISFKVHGEVIDYSFFLADFAQFCAVRKVLNDWINRGMTVVVRQGFEDDFIIGEMDYYGTPSGLPAEEGKDVPSK
jgi:hypothetical protein